MTTSDEAMYSVKLRQLGNPEERLRIRQNPAQVAKFTVQTLMLLHNTHVSDFACTIEKLVHRHVKPAHEPKLHLRLIFSTRIPLWRHEFLPERSQGSPFDVVPRATS